MDKFDCNRFFPAGFSSDCCSEQTTPIDSTKLQELIRLLNALINLLAAFLANPNNPDTKQALINLFQELLAFFNTFPPSSELNYVKQLIQAILSVLQASTLDLSKFLSLLQELFNALGSFFFTLIIDPATLQLLLNLLIQLIGEVPGGGATGPTGPTGATGTFAGIVPFNPDQAPFYLAG
ncbi:collagen-like repeat preface domain-containing protein, partial [Bacillus cereus]